MFKCSWTTRTTSF